ncbi:MULTISPECIES: DUF6152 family protein [Marinobacter]|uniref:DUF6152 family protein n=1 Tax=Marinobacter TaxID=2742 RepID=UPI001108C602|nr:MULTISPECIES: DUF6152 family protein [Marinobacter]
MWSSTRFFLWLLLPLILLFGSIPATAHHGWGWATDQEFEITGTIVAKRLGNPHGEVTLNVDGKDWLIEVGQPWRNQRAGLTAELLSEGRVITVHGHKSAKADERRVKAERVVIDGKDYNLYPDRPS